MKFLRALYMIIAAVLLAPVIWLVEVLWLIFLVAMGIKINDTKTALKAWWGYLRCGIEMNLDFIENGF